MSRSGYSDDCEDNWHFICWRGAVSAAIKGRRGQAFLNELIASLDALPEKKLIKDELVEDGAVCAIGAVGLRRGVDMEKINPHEPEQVAAAFGIATAMAQEIVYMNDEHFWRKTPEERFVAMREWAKAEIWSAKGCVENPSGELGRHRFGYGNRLHWQAVVAISEV